MLSYVLCYSFVFFFKQNTAYEMRISDWSSDVCSSDLLRIEARGALVDRDALLALLRLLGRARISRGHLHAGRIGELLHGVHEGEAALIGHPSDRVAVRRDRKSVV